MIKISYSNNNIFGLSLCAILRPFYCRRSTLFIALLPGPAIHVVYCWNSPTIGPPLATRFSVGVLLRDIYYEITISDRCTEVQNDKILDKQLYLPSYYGSLARETDILYLLSRLVSVPKSVI